MFAKFLNAPIPIALGMAVQAPNAVAADGPAWFMGFVAAIFLVVYVLKHTGRLPRFGEDHSVPFTDDDRERLRAIYNQPAADDAALRRIDEAHRPFSAEQMSQISDSGIPLKAWDNPTAITSINEMLSMVDDLGKEVGEMKDILEGMGN